MLAIKSLSLGALLLAAVSSATEWTTVSRVATNPRPHTDQRTGRIRDHGGESVHAGAFERLLEVLGRVSAIDPGDSEQTLTGPREVSTVFLSRPCRLFT
ncbi:hypothetical protein BO99DRAFT_233017 [Aspergillus violaceofuscus CBS 115571]|uniref:Uncharacterized protein n=1 Tax=Aspergillus violaceofuscus (strain CBS 115571) TaxID=1450538 RepID=A0A2V5H3B4_ASPV1|nr:hypothetical protein BO99DRAFT_233017 [Aspergillus violaceofuscus CBS 115571]